MDHVVTFLVVILGLLATPARADVDLEACVGGWLEVRAWIDDLAIPDSAHGAAAIPEASAVCIILRHRGRTVGFGLAHAEDEREAGETIVQSAAARAIEVAAKDETISALPDSVRREAGRQLTLEMEVAGPLLALMGRTFLEASERLRPGIDGLAMRHDERWWFQFPAQLRLTNAVVGPERLYSLALASELSPRQIETLRDRGDVSLYRFNTVDLAQAKPGDPPFMLTSGNLAVVEAEVTDDRLTAARDALARHVLSRLFTTDDGTRLVGSFTPRTSHFDQKSTSARDRYLVALSLARFARSANVDPELATEANTAAARLLEARPSVESSRTEEDPFEAAAWCLAAEHLDIADQGGRLDTVKSFLEEMVEADDVEVRDHAHDLVLAAAALSARSPEDRILATTSARRARDVLPVHQQVTLLPWLAWVDRSNRSEPGGPQSDSDLTSLRLIREQVLNLQVPYSTRPENTLDAGGFRLKPGPRGVTSQSLRPAVFLIETINDPAYDDPHRDEAIRLGHRRLLRYLLQLICREDIAGTWRQPDRIRGGIRHATWDARMHPAAQAMGLIVLSEATR